MYKYYAKDLAYMLITKQYKLSIMWLLFFSFTKFLALESAFSNSFKKVNMFELFFAQ